MTSNGIEKHDPSARRYDELLRYRFIKRYYYKPWARKLLEIDSEVSETLGRLRFVGVRRELPSL